MSVPFFGVRQGRKIGARAQFVKYVVDSTCDGISHLELLSARAEESDELEFDHVDFSAANESETMTRQLYAKCWLFNNNDGTFGLTMMAHFADGEDPLRDEDPLEGGQITLAEGFTEADFRDALTRCARGVHASIKNAGWEVIRAAPKH